MTSDGRAAAWCPPATPQSASCRQHALLSSALRGGHNDFRAASRQKRGPGSSRYRASAFNQPSTSPDHFLEARRARRLTRLCRRHARKTTATFMNQSGTVSSIATAWASAKDRPFSTSSTNMSRRRRSHRSQIATYKMARAAEAKSQAIWSGGSPTRERRLSRGGKTVRRIARSVKLSQTKATMYVTKDCR